MISFLAFDGYKSLSFVGEGFSAQYIHPIAEKVCKGEGYDIGCGKIEWVLKGARGIDPETMENEWSALNLPTNQVDFIFSSHCLEHIKTPWSETLDYWSSHLKLGGVLFLYLPHYDSIYWRSWNNPKHKHILIVEQIVDYLDARGYINIFFSGRDLNDSFTVIGEKV